MRAQFTLVGAVVISSCASLTSDVSAVSAPEMNAPTQFQSGEAANLEPVGDWLSQFEDPVLEDLVREALEKNPNLQATVARVDASRAVARSVRGSARPVVGAGVDVSGTSSAVEINNDAVRSEVANYGFDVSASWEPDLWGRISAGILASEADLSAAEADLAAAKLSLTAQTANAWISLNEALLQQNLAEQTVTVRERTLSLTERRFSRGLSTALDVRTARSAVESAKSSTLSRLQFTGESQRQLEVLLGRYPATTLTANAELKTLAPILPVGNPTDLLGRRPDVFASESRIVAAGFRADQARLALRPSLSLSASLSSSDDNFADVFDPQYLAARVLGSLTAPLYRGGTLRADIEAAEARARAAASDYINVVLRAWGEVEDALAADRILAERELTELRALEESRLAEELAERQYQNGLASIFNLIDAQTRRINSESSVISVKATRARNRINYHLALGGGLPVSAVTPTDGEG